MKKSDMLALIGYSIGTICFLVAVIGLIVNADTVAHLGIASGGIMLAITSLYNIIRIIRTSKGSKKRL